MRVPVGLIIGALITIGSFDATAEESFVESKIERFESTPELQGFFPFWKKKKKKVKTSSRLKKKNRWMGKKFRRQNDDTLRR
ncbi:MAG TPA: hypothetical protein VL728_17315 [Cyclobacteriaceae bacterium]|jgi:hypothetical protein|nr:hypothetical protein [Cyclobacteriaceae bacterium]